jgi:hypothetical protein
MNIDTICGTCKHWELIPQGCSSFWGRCVYTTDLPDARVPMPIFSPGEDVHFNDGGDCPCWEKKALVTAVS